jgi:protein TonB
MRLFLVLIILVACVACQQNPNNNSESKSTTNDTSHATIKDTITSISDTLKNTLPPPPPEMRALEFVAPRIEVMKGEYPDEMLPPIMDSRITESATYDDIRAEAIEAPYEPDKVYDVVDQMPEFLPKDQLTSFIADNLVYPENAREQGLEGVVKISFIVEKDGRVSGATILKSSNFAELDMEAIRVVKKMPRFAPGRINGLAVRSRMTLPITFLLRD